MQAITARLLLLLASHPWLELEQAAERFLHLFFVFVILLLLLGNPGHHDVLFRDQRASLDSQFHPLLEEKGLLLLSLGIVLGTDLGTIIAPVKDERLHLLEVTSQHVLDLSGTNSEQVILLRTPEITAPQPINIRICQFGSRNMSLRLDNDDIISFEIFKRHITSLTIMAMLNLTLTGILCFEALAALEESPARNQSSARPS